MKDLNSLSNSWQTPQWLFDELNREFNFNIDLCATKENSKCDHFYTDYLTNQGYKKSYNSSVFINIEDRVCFMNPPYSNPKPFIQKAWEDSKYCKIVCLIKCDPSTSMWNIFYDFEKEQERPGCKVVLLNKRIKYVPPKDYIMPTCGHCNGFGKVNQFESMIRRVVECTFCNGTGKRPLTGPSFPSCLVIMDRRIL